MARHVTKNAAHPTSSILGPGPHVSVHGIPKRECWRSEDTHQKEKFSQG